jgi:ABC-type transport system involved in multi-copper enzyme maturation permease subunit
MTPIHDQSYRHYHGGKATPGRSWMVIANAGIREVLRKRIFLGLLLMGWMQFIVRSIMLYFSTSVQQLAVLGASASTFRDFLDYQGFVVFVITVYVGAGLIANDRRANALQIYLSKPLMRSEYIAGKLAILFVFLLMVTMVPALMLVVVQVVLSGSFAFVQRNLFLIPAITVAALLQVLLASMTMLALSSLSKSARFVAIMYVGIFFFTKAVFGVLYAITGTSAASWISPGDALAQVVDVIFRLKPRYVTPWQVSLLLIIAAIVVSISVLEKRVRGVEVVT